MNKRFDVVIVGGAMVGATLGIALAKQSVKPLTIAVIEAVKPSSEHPGLDNRSIAVSHHSITQLTQLGIWHHIAPCSEPIKQIQVSEQGRLAKVNMCASEYNLDVLGAVIELKSVGQSLYRQLQQALTLYCPEKVTHIERHTDRVDLTLSSGEEIQAGLVVAADGTFSAVCEQVNLKRSSTSFEQHAVIANVTFSKPHHNRAFERFTKQGPLALLPMHSCEHPTQQMSLVWCCAESQLTQALSYDDQQFIQQLQSHFGWQLGEIIQVSQRYSYPLQQHRRVRDISHRMVAIGNAAQTLHPIAGQGFNLGLRDAVSLLEILTDDEHEIGSEAQLMRYHQARLIDKQQVCLFTESLVRLFSNDHSLLGIARSNGMRLFDRAPWLKHRLIMRSMGWGIDG